MNRDGRVEQIREREQKATNGPWIWYTSNSYRRLGQEGPYNEVAYPTTLSDGHPHIVVPNDGDLEFIAHARQDIPYLLDRLQAAEERVAWGVEIVFSCCSSERCQGNRTEVRAFPTEQDAQDEVRRRREQGFEVDGPFALYRRSDAAREALTEGEG